ncbi:mRNA surveillance protein pelota [Candidatus Woesearchaeota archaeon]|nr:mRNA surveillance protein pelota [Candidatus Woesearchaeota archaeon]
MDIVHSDFKKGKVKLRIHDMDDLWYLSHIIDVGDFVKGKTTRKMKVGKEETKMVKKTITLKIEVEKVEFHKYGDSLRVNGKVVEGPDDIPRGSYHTISLEEGSEFVLEKKEWLSYQKKKLEEAAEKKFNFLICVFDREEAILALSKKYGYDVLLTLKGDVARKRKKVDVKKDFYTEIITALGEYEKRYAPESIILASPAFFKDDLMKKLNDKELKKKIVLATCGSVSENAIDEVLKKPELQNALKKSRVREEELLVEELLVEITKDGLVAYGFKEVTVAVEAGAVIKLLVGDYLIQELRQDEDYEKLDNLMKQVDSSKGEVHIISSDHDGGKKLKGLGGIGALLRYKL